MEARTGRCSPTASLPMKMQSRSNRAKRWFKMSSRSSVRSAATFAPKLVKEDGHLDFSCPAIEIANRIHGTWPWPGGHAVFRHAGGKTREVIIEAVKVADGGTGKPGTVDEDLMIATGSGRLEIVELKPSGKRLMDWKRCRNWTQHRLI